MEENARVFWRPTCYVISVNQAEKAIRIFKAILVFYQKLIVPTSMLSGVLGVLGIGITGEFSLKTFGVSYIILGLLFHYYTYELRNSNEYYFYYNMGLSRPVLWAVTSVFGFLTGLVFILL